MPTRRQLSLAELRAAFGRFSYKPGWRFLVWEDPFEGPHISVQATLKNAYRPDETVELDIVSALPPLADEDAVAAWLAWRLGRIENHEMREWLRRDGVRVSDPHQDVAATPVA